MILDAFKLDGKVALVTGGGGGLGRTIALALAEVGAYVVIASRSSEKGEETAQLISKAGGTCIFLKTDVTKSDEVEATVEKTVSTFSRIDILVNNAGIQLAKPVLEMEEEAWHRVINTNLTGTFLCSKLSGKYMIQQKKGKVINISSTAGFVAATNQSSYCASKAGIILFTKALALEWAKYHINVNAIAPGYLRTSFSASALDDDKIASILLKRIPLRRFGEPKDIAPLIIYLASPVSNYMTGETILIDGGHLSHM
jgi:NAD(P)-dependent dehydrogenase (short-subunit alcohol dehydrogenase family)